MKTRVANEPLANLLDRHTVPGAPELCRVEDDRIRCLACGHRCLIGNGLRGICKVRFNEGGQLKVPFGYVAGLQSDPVEKKPFFHVLPGSDALTFGMLGCDLHCTYCQNWLTSQALRDSAAVAPIRELTAAQLIEVAQRERSRLVVSSYNEPLITAEWAVAVFEQARAAGLACAFVSNGNATPEALDFLRPWIIAYKIDLKSFTERSYRSLGGTLENITETIRMVHERGIWLEVVTLVIPGFNDSDEELRQAARFLASVSPNIPWHLTAFHQDYKMTDPEPTSSAALMRAAEIGSAEGLRFVYAGNLPGQVGPWENTRCPSCRATLIERFGYLIRSYRLTPEGRCPDCQAEIPGIWPRLRDEVRTGNDLASYKSRLPRSVAVSPGVATHASRSLPLVEPRHVSSLQGAPAMSSVTPPAVAVKSHPAQRPDLSAEERQRIAAAVAALLRAAVQGQPTNCLEALGNLRERPVAGAFVSIKRGRHLRSCCGMLGQPIPLAQAIATAASRTAREDERFPPLSPTEVDYLDVEVWLLDNLQPVQARGEDRVEAVTVGKHGVQVVRGPSSGLFLPGVAVESNWDTRRFLDQVCVKAGLHPSSWKDDGTALFTFEGDALRCQTASVLPSAAVRRTGPCSPEEVSAFATFCLGNLGALLTGRTPSYYFAGSDGSVNGVVLSVRRPDLKEPLRLSQLSLRHGLPLQSTLFTLVQKAVQLLASERLQPAVLSRIEMDLAFLHDPMMHGTVRDPHLAGLDSRHRTVLVVERNKTALLYNPTRPAQELVAEAASQAGVTDPDTAGVFSLDTLTNGAGVRVVNVPRAVRGAGRSSAGGGRDVSTPPTPWNCRGPWTACWRESTSRSHGPPRSCPTPA